MAASEARQNSFGFARFAAASGVIFSHQFAVAGFAEPNIAGITFGTASVCLFFLMSGHLIFQSLSRNHDFSRFLSARLLRIGPNLLFVLITTSGLALLHYGNYGHVLDHMRYVAQNLLMLVQGGVRYDIAGIWQDRPYTAINGSLWTLPYEVWCYITLYCLVRWSGSRSVPTVALAFALCAGLWQLTSLRLWPLSINTASFGGLGLWFFAGALVAALGRQLPLLRSPAMAWFDRGGDPSYGMYIFAWPVQQMSAILIPDFWLSMAVAFCATTAIGYATWHGFERKALAHVRQFAAWLQALGARRS